MAEIANKDFKEKILLVDDDDTVLQVLEAYFSEYNTVSAKNGVEALEKFKQDNFFLVISDYEMPGLNGLELLNEVKHISPNTAFLMLTGMINRDTISVDSEIDDFFKKPVKAEKIKESVRRLYEKRLEEYEEEKALFDGFIEDSRSNLKELEENILDLKSNKENLQPIKRILHTIKGTASFFALAPIEELCHTTEDLIKAVPENSSPSDLLIELLLSSYDKINEMIDTVAVNKTHEFNNSYLLKKIKTATKDPEKLTEKEEASQETKSKLKEQDGIYVKSEKLDSLMELGGELIIARNSLYDLALTNDIDIKFQEQKIKEVYQQVDMITHNIQNNIMEVRRIPISNIISSYRRIVYNMAKQTKKKVTFTTNAAGIYVDKDICKSISEALVHIIRNAVDHGLESPEERKKSNKKETGNVSIMVQDSNESTSIVIKDDGRGLDKEKISRKAIEKNLSNEDKIKNLTDSEIYNFIFSPAFSTKTQVTKISGRGEGMEIVKDAIEKLNGTITIKSSPNEGSEFQIEIPHKKSINVLEALLVEIENNTFALPFTVIKSVNAINKTHIHSSDGKQRFINLNDEIINIFDLQEIIPSFKQNKNCNKDNEACTIVILKSNNQTFGLIVTNVLDPMEIVCRPLHKTIGKAKHFSGTTILKNGTPALILDPEYIVEKIAA